MAYILLGNSNFSVVRLWICVILMHVDTIVVNVFMTYGFVVCAPLHKFPFYVHGKLIVSRTKYENRKKTNKTKFNIKAKVTPTTHASSSLHSISRFFFYPSVSSAVEKRISHVFFRYILAVIVVIFSALIVACLNGMVSVCGV